MLLTDTKDAAADAALAAEALADVSELAALTAASPALAVDTLACAEERQRLRPNLQRWPLELLR
jgi:hypothetical protein